MRQGEKNADVIKIVSPRFYGETDLAACGFVLEGVNSEGTAAVQTLTKESDENALTLTWTVTADFAAVTGPMRLTLKAVSADGETIIIYEGGEIEITGEYDEELVPAEVSEQLLTQVEGKIAMIDDLAAQAVDTHTNEFLQNLDLAPYVESCLPDNLVTGDSVRTLEVVTAAAYDAIAAPSADTLYIVV